MVVGRPIWEVIKNVVRSGDVITIRIHIKKVADKKTSEPISHKFSIALLKERWHVLFITQGVRCLMPDKIDYAYHESVQGDYYVIDLSYDTSNDTKQLSPDQRSFLNLLV